MQIAQWASHMHHFLFVTKIQTIIHITRSIVASNTNLTEYLGTSIFQFTIMSFRLLVYVGLMHKSECGIHVNVKLHV